MRTIKFRAWDNVCKKMEYEFSKYSWYISHDGELVEQEDNWGEDCWMHQKNKTDYKLMQYTGLHDKNGIEIYEGDVIRCIWKDDVSLNEKEWIAECKPIGENTFHFYSEFESIDCVIIGNIYENPELLTDK